MNYIVHWTDVALDELAAVWLAAVELPLGIEYDVIEDDKTVRILRVWSLV
jgi:hypothetical protein